MTCLYINGHPTALPANRTTVPVSVNGCTARKPLVVILPRAVNHRTREGIGLREPRETVTDQAEPPGWQLLFVLEPGAVVEAGA